MPAASGAGFRGARPCVAAAILSAAWLCGCRDDRWGSVEGRVTVAGHPVAAGRVVFRNETNTLDGPIDATGRYRLTWKGSPRVPVGEYAVMLLPPERHAAPAPETAVEDRLFPVRLRAADSSGVRCAIPAGVSTVDVDF